MIPFFNLKRENALISNDLEQAVLAVIQSGNYIMGPQLTLFESQFAKYTGTKYCIGVGNGLDALILILRAVGIQKGDEVLVPAHTFIATWFAVSQVGATIVPIEPDRTYNLDVDNLSQYITNKTKAIIPVHLYGRPANMFKINLFAKKHSLYVIEDAAQAQGSSLESNMCGNLSNAAAFSFYPIKNLGALGDAGAITTNNKHLAQKLFSLRNYGSIKKYNHQNIGVNSRLDEIQASVLSIKLSSLDANNKAKETIAKKYLTLIKNAKVILPPEKETDAFIAWHQFVLKVVNRDDFIKHMNRLGIGTMIHYPVPPHESGAYSSQFKPSRFPITSQLCKSIVSIPLYASLTDVEVEYIIDSINKYV